MLNELTHFSGQKMNLNFPKKFQKSKFKMKFVEFFIKIIKIRKFWNFEVVLNYTKIIFST